jgi:hypothetical protein
MILAAAGLLVAAALPRDELELRPWQAEQTLAEELELRRGAANGPEEWRELAEWCARYGFFDAQLAALYEAGAAPVTEGEPASVPVDLGLATLNGTERRALLHERDKPARLANKTTYFDLHTDLDTESQRFYAELLNGYYRSLRSRFAAWPGGAIDVILFRNRADYLLGFQRATGASFEHVLGFYVPGLKLLCFYDERHDRADVAVTARHECTHLLMDLAYDGAPVPKWLGEGLACFLAADGEAMRGVQTAGRLLLALESVQLAERPYLTELLETDYSRFGGAHYPPAWSWVHYLNVSSSASGRRWQKFLRRLRTDLDGEMDEDACRKQVKATFRDVFGDTAELQEGWDLYWGETFALRDAEQVLDFGWAALELSREGADRDRAPLRLDWSQRAFAALAGDSFRARLGHAACLVERIDTDVAGPEALALGLRAVRDALRAVPAEGDDGRIGLVALAALRATKPVLALEDEPLPFDLRAALGPSGPKGEELVDLHDDLLALAADSLRAALAADPAHRTAAHAWVELATEVAPAALEPVLATLRLLVQIDPDDRNLADLAVVQAQLGDPVWARKLFADAKERSVRPDLLGAERLADTSAADSLAPEACTLCAGASSWPCERCQSKGHRRQSCGTCRGEGEFACPFCDEGEWPCPGCRGAGEIQWESGDADPCKICSRRGTFRCAFCSGRGELRCEDCGARGTLVAPCEACVGAGLFPCPRCRPEACVVCKGRRTRTCLSCAGDGQIESLCEHCAGTGERFCKGCFAARNPCASCHGAGSLRYVFERGSQKSKVERCETCEGRGFERCTECRDGTVKCEEPDPVAACEECEGGKVACERCR